jgi:hypothetical protein
LKSAVSKNRRLAPREKQENELGPLTRSEMVEILEHIARNGGDTARIQAIKTLLRLEEGGNLDFDELEALVQRK